MADIKSKESRSYNMSRITGKNTKPEEIVRKYLFSKGFRYRKNDRKLPGSPDLVLPKYRTVIFVNGCFWHGHKGCKYFVWPENNAEFWRKKIETTSQGMNGKNHNSRRWAGMLLSFGNVSCVQKSDKKP